MLQKKDAQRQIVGRLSSGIGRLRPRDVPLWTAAVRRRVAILIIVSAASALATTAATGVAAEKDTHHYTDDEIEGLFASTCGFCHSDGGRIAGKGPQLMGTKRSDAFIINRIKHGKESRMPAFGDTFDDAEIKGIIHYIRNLKPD